MSTASTATSGPTARLGWSISPARTRMRCRRPARSERAPWARRSRQRSTSSRPAASERSSRTWRTLRLRWTARRGRRSTRCGEAVSVAAAAGGIPEELHEDVEEEQSGRSDEADEQDDEGPLQKPELRQEIHRAESLPERSDHRGTNTSAVTGTTPAESEPRARAAPSDRSITRSRFPYGPRSFTSTITQRSCHRTRRKVPNGSVRLAAVIKRGS